MRSLGTSKNRLVLSLIMALCFHANAESKAAKSAAAAKPVEAGKPAAPGTAAAEDKKVDISDLENKYWAPKDTDFSVVQNRTYSKDHRFILSAQYGIPINDSHSDGSLYGLTGNYFFSERSGIQLSYIKASLKNNESTRDLVNFAGGGVQPNHDRLNSYLGVGYNYVPFYAKMSFMGSKIMYFDMAITPMLGITTYDQILANSTPSKSALTYGVDITQYFFFSRWLAFRADLKNQWYSQEIRQFYNTAGVAKEGDKVKDKMYHDSLFMIGATFFFW